MGVYKLNAQELADIINSALNEAEGDFDINELKKAFRLVELEQRETFSIEKEQDGIYTAQE